MSFTAEAQVAWDNISAADHEQLLSGGFCSRCFANRHFTLDQGEMRGTDLALIGHCDTCGGRIVVRVGAA